MYQNYTWEELGLSITIEDFSGYEAISSIFQIERIFNLSLITTNIVETGNLVI